MYIHLVKEIELFCDVYYFISSKLTVQTLIFSLKFNNECFEVHIIKVSRRTTNTFNRHFYDYFLATFIARLQFTLKSNAD